LLAPWVFGNGCFYFSTLCDGTSKHGRASRIDIILYNIGDSCSKKLDSCSSWLVDIPSFVRIEMAIFIHEKRASMNFSSKTLKGYGIIAPMRARGGTL